ncbi:MAG: ABC transporter substrate-binding protein [Ignavibacteriae bacterium]|nr:MAG: ABC transporter substrate-binding protein [Ignavibacteriota bacterium]
MKFKYISFLLVIVLLSAAFSSCGKSKRKVIFDTKPVSIKTVDTPPGADPSVSAEMGGEGFKGEGWISKTDYNILGDPNAVKGGSLIMSIPDFPATLRTEGKDANSYFNRMAQGMMYEPLLSLDPVTEEYIPALATHYKISDDHMTFTFRIDPRARWADGKPVTSEDVIATWKLMVDPGILEAYSNILYGTYEPPVAVSKYIVSVKSKELNWRQFLYFAVSMRIMPAHYIGISGKEYLEKYQFEFIPGSGPYMIDVKDVNKGQSIMIRRRSDYWAEKEKYNTGLFNFDLVRFEVVTDPSLEFEKFKKGEIDVISVSRAQWWIERFDFDEYKRGLVQKRRIFNENPNGVSGICFNMRKPPFDDIRVRQAFSHLYDREKYNEKLFYNMYYPIYSFFPGSVYENPNNPKVKFDIDKAQQLLAEAGWKDKNPDGYLLKNGKVFEVELPFSGGPGQERYLTVYQEDLKKVGVKLNLRQIDGTTNFKLGNERNFTMLSMAWSGLRIPNPESSMGPGTADQPNTTNWNGIKDPRIDELCKQYNVSFDKAERIKIVREIDAIATAMQPYAFGWYGPYQRVAYHNKFGFPEWMLSRTDDFLIIPSMWYNDPVQAAEYEDAKKDNKLTMTQGEVDHKFWVNLKEREDKGEKVILTSNKK